MKLKTCADIAYEPDCKIKAQLGLCNTNLSNNIPVSAYCPKSCNVCKSNCQLTCDQVDCNGGSCCATSYFSQPSVQCTCPSDRGGTYCQLGTFNIHQDSWLLFFFAAFLNFLDSKANPCLFMPCKNGGQCSPSYTDYMATYTCSCPQGYTGKNCEICTRSDPCTEFACLNGGTCLVDVSGKPVCACKTGYSGDHCDSCKLCFFK